ncbi:MAG: phage holin family protein [Verrucomicrobiota bacterium]
MNPAPAPQANSIPALLRDLRDETTTLLHQEVALAKAELAEKVSKTGGHLAHLAVGGFVTYAGIIVLLIGIGHLLGTLMTRFGLDPAVATWLAPSLVGLVVALIGWAMLTKAKRALSKTDFTPRQTVASMRETKEWTRHKLKILS